MNLHEYQGKQLFKEFGLPVSEELKRQNVLVETLGLLNVRFTLAAAVKRAV